MWTPSLTATPTFQLEDELLLQGGEMSCGATPTHGEGALGMSGGPLQQHRRRGQNGRADHGLKCYGPRPIYLVIGA
jgi:hypothetical protein